MSILNFNSKRYDHSAIESIKNVFLNYYRPKKTRAYKKVVSLTIDPIPMELLYRIDKKVEYEMEVFINMYNDLAVKDYDLLEGSDVRAWMGGLGAEFVINYTPRTPVSPPEPEEVLNDEL